MAYTPKRKILSNYGAYSNGKSSLMPGGTRLSLPGAEHLEGEDLLRLHVPGNCFRVDDTRLHSVFQNLREWTGMVGGNSNRGRRRRGEERREGKTERGGRGRRKGEVI